MRLMMAHGRRMKDSAEIGALRHTFAVTTVACLWNKVNAAHSQQLLVQGRCAMLCLAPRSCPAIQPAMSTDKQPHHGQSSMQASVAPAISV